LSKRNIKKKKKKYVIKKINKSNAYKFDVHGDRVKMIFSSSYNFQQCRKKILLSQNNHIVFFRWLLLYWNKII